MRGSGAHPSSLLVAWVEDDRVRNRYDAAFGLREREIVEPSNDETNDALIRDVRATVACTGDSSGAVDDEANCHATLEVRVRAQTVLVAETEATEVLTNDAAEAFPSGFRLVRRPRRPRSAAKAR